MDFLLPLTQILALRLFSVEREIMTLSEISTLIQIFHILSYQCLHSCGFFFNFEVIYQFA